jgi:hypothetical protein
VAVRWPEKLRREHGIRAEQWMPCSSLSVRP